MSAFDHHDRNWIRNYSIYYMYKRRFMTMRQIAEKLNLSHQRVHQILNDEEVKNALYQRRFEQWILDEKTL